MQEFEVERYLINKNTQESYKIEKELVFGRKTTSDIVIKDDLISGNHFKVSKDKGRVFLTDLASFNHTYLNNAEIPENKSIEIELGDEIRAGSQTYILHDAAQFDQEEEMKAELLVQSVTDDIDDSLEDDISHPELKLRTEQLFNQKKKVDDIITRIKSLESTLVFYEDHKEQIIKLEKDKVELNKLIDLSKVHDLKKMKEEYLSLKQTYEKIIIRLAYLETQVSSYIEFDEADKKIKILRKEIVGIEGSSEINSEIARLQFELANEQEFLKNLHINYEKVRREIEKEVKEEKKYELRKKEKELKKQELEQQIKNLEEELKNIK